VPRGEVLEFDEPAGYGTIRSSDGRDLFFHCTAISNGTRTIPPGSEVTFTVVPGRLGRWEAAAVEAILPA
jgi:cold shock protein